MGLGWRLVQQQAVSPRRFDLERASRAFTEELQTLLNNTICNGIALNSVAFSGPPARTNVGYKISKTNLDVSGIPITCGRREPNLYLGLSIRLAPDDQEEHLMVTSSVVIVAVDEDVADDSKVLLHYDYERDKPDGYPEAHLQIHATSDAWQVACGIANKELEKMHLPVGGRRFRPTLEDVLEFLVREGLADSHPQCDAILEERRTAFYEKQLRAAVRRNPHAAVEQLRSLGYEVNEPKT